jgi:uncharacterized protein (DUF934 family)
VGAAQAAIIPLPRLIGQWEAVVSQLRQIGTSITNTVKISELRPLLGKLKLIALPFPAFTDGRSYSLARQLRHEGFEGELRATGNILPDQIRLMQRVGVDAFEVDSRFPLEVWQKFADKGSPTYQRNLANRQAAGEVWSVRQQGFEPWLEQPHAG